MRAIMQEFQKQQNDTHVVGCCIAVQRCSSSSSVVGRARMTMVKVVTVMIVMSGMTLVSCTKMRRPTEFVLGTGTIAQPVTLQAVTASEETMTESEAKALLIESREWTQLMLHDAEVPTRGVCVLLPGIVGKSSALLTRYALRKDGWHVIEVAPPLIARVKEVLAQNEHLDARAQGRAVGTAVDVLISAATQVTIAQLVCLSVIAPEVRTAPLFIVGESLGAIMGVGLAATGAVAHEALVLVAGGGSLLDVASTSAIRGLVLSEQMFEDPEFRAGFVEYCRLDPLRAAPALAGCPVVVISAERDLIVPSATQEALWIALGKPPRFVYEGGHLALFVDAFGSIVPVLRETAELIAKNHQASQKWYAQIERSRREILDAPMVESE